MKIPSLNAFRNTFNDPVWDEVATLILQRHKIRFVAIERAKIGENIVFFVGKELILKIYTPLKNGFRRERAALQFARGRTSIMIPDTVAEGEIEGYYYMINTQLDGEIVTRDRWLALDPSQQVSLLTELATGLNQLHSRDARKMDFNWREFLKIQVSATDDKHLQGDINPEWRVSIPKYIEENLSLIPTKPFDSFQHGDVHFGNMRVAERGGKMRISGLFDFADSITGFHEYEFVAIGVLMIQGQGELQREFFRAYGFADSDLDETFRRRLMTLTLLYEYGSLHRYALRLRPEAVNYSLSQLERAIWNFV